MNKATVQLKGVTKEYRRGDNVLKAVDGVSLTAHEGEFISIMGKSGSGKSTMLHLMSGLIEPSDGQVLLLGQDLAAMSDDARTLLRRQRVGFIFQFFNLLPTLTALENVALPLLMAKVKVREAEERARKLLAMVGLSERANHKPDELSGGQMQRVAIARALMGDPPLLFADEPTGNLDSVSGEEILTLLKSMQQERGMTIVMVTHDAKAAAYGDRMITMRDGRIQDDLRTGGKAV